MDQELVNQRGMTERATKALEEVLISGPLSDASENEVRVLRNILSLLRAHLAIVQDERTIQSSIAAFQANVVPMNSFRQDRGVR